MLPRESRLNLKKDFRWVAAGQKTENGLAKIFFRFGDNPLPRIGIATSKTNFKKAVERNRVRRVISKGFEELYDFLPRGLNVVVLPKAEVLKLKSDNVTDVLKKSLAERGIFNNDQKNRHNTD